MYTALAAQLNESVVNCFGASEYKEIQAAIPACVP